MYWSPNFLAVVFKKKKFHSKCFFIISIWLVFLVLTTRGATTAEKLKFWNWFSPWHACCLLGYTRPSIPAIKHFHASLISLKPSIKLLYVGNCPMVIRPTEWRGDATDGRAAGRRTCDQEFAGLTPALVFSTSPRDLLGRTSSKWPILCRVGRKTLTQSINCRSGRGFVTTVEKLFVHTFVYLSPSSILVPISGRWRSATRNVTAGLASQWPAL